MKNLIEKNLALLKFPSVGETYHEKICVDCVMYICYGEEN